MPPLRRLIARLLSFVRQKLALGFLALFPFAFTVWVLVKILGFLDGIIGKYLIPVPGLGLLTLLALLVAAGTLVTSYVGRRLFRLYDAILSRLPLARTVYVGSKQLVEALSLANRSAFSRVVLLEYPRKGVYALGFVTKEGVGEVQARTPEHVTCVFLPTTPNPTSGFLLLVPDEQMIPLDMSVEDGVKMIVSGGLVVPEAPVRVAPRELAPAGPEAPGRLPAAVAAAGELALAQPEGRGGVPPLR